MAGQILCGVVPEEPVGDAPLLVAEKRGKLVGFTSDLEEVEDIEMKPEEGTGDVGIGTSSEGSWARPREQVQQTGTPASDRPELEKRGSRIRGRRSTISTNSDGGTAIEEFLVFHFRQVQQDLAASQERMLHSILPVLLRGEAVRAASRATSVASGQSGGGAAAGGGGPLLSRPVSDPKLSALGGSTVAVTGSGTGNSPITAGGDAAGGDDKIQAARTLTLPFQGPEDSSDMVSLSLTRPGSVFSVMPVDVMSFVRSGELESEEELFQVLDIWTRMKQKRARLDNAGRSVMSTRMMEESKCEESMEDVKSNRKKPKIHTQRFVVHPNDLKRTSWDFISLLLVLYDMVMIPLALFDLPDNDFTNAMAWLTRVFWTVDIPLSFLSGYVTPAGSIMLERSVIIRRYLRTWFLLDTFIVGIDWLEILITAAISNYAGVTRVGKVTRVFRIVRMLRLLRLARIGEIIALRFEAIHNERAKVFIQILKLCIMMCATGHFLGCLWYRVGLLDPDTNWIIVYGYDKVSVDKQYLMALRWAFSQFSGGMDEIQPRSSVENLFAAFVFLLAFWCGAVFVSLITSVMTKFFIEGHHNNAKLTDLRNYLEQHKISKSLVLRLTRNAQHSLWERERRTPEDAVELVNLLSEPLRAELRFEIYSPGLGGHPFFSRYVAENPNVMKHVCHNAMSMGIVSSGDTVFEPGETPENPRMYFVNHGRLAYMAASGDEQEVLPGGWACEAVLWTKWTTLGKLEAAQDTRLYILDANKFQSIASSFEHTDFNPAEYAEEFVDSMNDGDVSISDLPDPQDVPQIQSVRQTFRASTALW